MMINTSHVGFFFSIVPFRTFLKKKNAKPKHKKVCTLFNIMYNTPPVNKTTYIKINEVMFN
jgi:hypothetical protein